MTLTRPLRALASLLVAALAMTLHPGSAHADPHPSHDGVVSSDPTNLTPDVLDGHVNSFAQVGDTMIVGGEFSEVDDGTVHERHNIFAFSTSTGQVLPSFSPEVDGEVFDLELSSDAASVVVVGAFSAVNTTPKSAKVAKLAVADGSLVAGFKAPKPNGVVRDVVTGNGYLYIGGAFTTLGGEPREYLAALNPDGSDSDVAAFNFSGTNNGGSTNVRSLDISPDGSTLVVAGNFAAINGVAHGQLALLSVSATSSTLSPWATSRFAPACGPHFDTYMRDVAFAPSGTYFVVVTTGGPRGFQKSGLLCDSATRWEVSADAPAQPTWINYTGGDTLTAAIVDANAVYIGGHQRWVNNSFGHNNARMGAVAREGVAALDPLNGLPYSWDPGRRRGYGVYGFAITADGLWVGSDTVGFGGELRGRIAFCPTVGGTDLPAYVTASLPGRLVVLKRPGGVRVQTFDGHQVGPADTLASAGWQGLRAAFVVDQVLYAGWANGSLTAQDFDGTSLGSASEIDLRGSFTDLADVRAMFFDRATHRIYYTRTGIDQLYYRYFQPESQTIGSWRYDAPPGSIDWTRVGETFLIKKKLFVTSTTSGNLRRVAWDPSRATVTGGAVNLLGPALNGEDYRAAGVVAIS